MTTQSTSKAPRKRTTRRGAPASAEAEKKTLVLGDALQGGKAEPLDRKEVACIVGGVLLLALSFFTLLSLVSFLFTGDMDQKLFESSYAGTPMNWCGRAGAWWSQFWMTENFGLGAFFIPIFLFAAAFKLLDAFHIRLWKWFVNCAFLLCWTSVAAAFFLTSYFSGNPEMSYISPGGYHGIHLVEILEGASGQVGTFIIILLTLLAYLCYLSAETIRFIKRLMHPKQLARDFGDSHPRIARLFLWLKQVLTPKRKQEEDIPEGEDTAEDDAESEPTEAGTEEQDNAPADVPDDIRDDFRKSGISQRFGF